MWASNHVAQYSVTGQMPPRQGTGHPTLTPYQAFECSDGPLMICPGNDRLWRKFAEVLGHPEWPDEARFKTNVDRFQRREMLLGMVGEIMRKESRAHWSARLDALGVPNGPLNSVPQVLELAQTAALGMFTRPYAGSDALFHGLPLSIDGERAGGMEKSAEDRRAQRRGMTRFLLPIVWIAWGLAYPLMSWSLKAADLFSTRLIILPLSGLILLGVGVVRGAPLWPERSMWGPLALSGLFNMGLFQIFLISGIALLGPSRTPVIVYTMPAWSALFAVFLLKERISFRVALSLLLSLLAVALIISQEAAVRRAPIGTVLTLLAAISFGIGTVLTKRYSLRGDPAINAGWQLLLGTLSVVLVWLVWLPHAYFRPEETRGLFALVFLILISNALAYFCWFRIIQLLPASVASLTTLVVPCVGFASSALLVGGAISRLDIVALGLIVTAVMLVLSQPQPAKLRQ